MTSPPLPRAGRGCWARTGPISNCCGRALEQAGTPYVDVVAAVCALLPRLGRRKAGLGYEAWEAGPPREKVELQPLAPPEYLTGYGTRT